jgi:biotin carboxyl carrier protein
VLEAMKMNRPMVAPRDGMVTSLAVKAGDAVEAGRVLATIA